MKKIILSIVLVVIVVMITTTPKNEDYKYQLKAIVNNKVENDNVMREVDTTEYGTMKDVAYEAGTALGQKSINQSIDDLTNTKNYILFSTGYYKDEYVGFGIFGNIFIDGKLLEYINK